LDPGNLTKCWLSGRVDVHLHRKIWRTTLFQGAVRSIPSDIRERRVCRCEDRLLSGFVMLHLKGIYRYIRTVGEIRHYGWPDNSMSHAYQSGEKTAEDCDFAWNWTERHFMKYRFYFPRRRRRKSVTSLLNVAHRRVI
jgi:hypothetical protein